ncbi:MAG: 30S ribosomal protein S3 [Candidatus Margulisiibacteriota bacterium]|jgi:small subunit ribosomal protein S3
MGQKIDPRGLRLGVIRYWDSNWFADKGYAALVLEDFNIRKFINAKLKRVGITSIKIRRRASQVEVDIYTARPGMIIGKGGSDADALRAGLERLVSKTVQLNVHEQTKPDMSAAVLAETITTQLEKRMPFRQIMKQAVNRCLKAGAKGVKVRCAGRLAGAEIARCEWYREGRVPLHTIRSDIDFVKAEANTNFGKIGVKVWVYKGDVFNRSEFVEGMEKFQLGPEVPEDATT